MEFNDYQEAAARTAIYPGRGTLQGLAYSSLGLGEAGEVQGKVKKLLRDKGLSMDTPLSELSLEVRLAIAKELGDSLWYIAETANQLGFELNEIAQMNVYKLSERAQKGTLKGSGDDR